MMNVDFCEFIVTGKFGLLEMDCTEEDVFNILDEPDIFTRERKSYPSIAVYKDIEFRFRSKKIKTITLSIPDKEISLPRTIQMVGLLDKSQLHQERIKKLLFDKGVSWKLDEIMSDESQINYISTNNIHFVFDMENSGVLCKVGVDYYC